MENDFGLKNISGLTEKEVKVNFHKFGPNILPSEESQSVLSIFISVIKEPMFLLLLGSGFIYILLGEIADSMVLLFAIFVIIGITFYEERKTKRALEALRNLSSPRALVIRDSVQKRIPGVEVVSGDILILKEGDRVPADALLLSSTNLSIDESLLTGESLPVQKNLDKQPRVFSGTLVVSGTGIAKVTAVGSSTEMGKIGKTLNAIIQEDTLLKKETGKFVRFFAVIGLILCLFITGIYGITRGDWLNGILSGLTLSMSMIPEEFPVILIIFSTLGAWRISKKNVLTRRTDVLETFGATTVLCVDKTGTLTENKMELVTISAGNKFTDISSGLPLENNFQTVLKYAFLASKKDPFDPIEKAISHAAKQIGPEINNVWAQWKRTREYPISKDLLTISHAWLSPAENEILISAKGAPEAIADLCHFSKEKLESLEIEIQKMANNGFRLIGVAKANINYQKDLPWDQHDFPFEFIGLLGFLDPVRSGVADSLSQAYTAGIKIIMITGDFPGTACFVAHEIGLKNPDKYLTGMEIEKMDKTTLQQKIREVNIFARVVPQQKLKIVNALKANGEIVAMTGDGVNDAPALKSAHIGIAMGERGTDVAREASDLVLLDDDFSSIISAIKFGRRIYDNLKKASSFILSVHLPIAGMALLPIIFNLPIVLFPIHIAFLELIIDPACSIVFENGPEERNIMTKPPRDLKKPFFDKNLILLGLLQGLSILATVFLTFSLSIFLGKNSLESRTLTYLALIFSNLMLILTNLSWSKTFLSTLLSTSKTTWLIICGTVGTVLLILLIPFLRSIFQFTLISFTDLLLTILAGVIGLIWFEFIKLSGRYQKILFSRPSRDNRD